MDEYYRYSLDGVKFTLAKEIAFELLKDLKGRKGFSWDDLDDDVREEFIATWVSKVEAKLNDSR